MKGNYVLFIRCNYIKRSSHMFRIPSNKRLYNLQEMHARYIPPYILRISNPKNPHLSVCIAYYVAETPASGT